MEPTKKSRKPAPAKKYDCQFCGESFWSNGASPKYCNARCRGRARYARDREKLAAAGRARRATPEYANWRKSYAAANRERNRANSRRSYQRHREKRIAEAIAYQAAHPEVVALTRNRRKAAVAFKVSQRDHRRLLVRFEHRCAYCRTELGAWGRDAPNSLQWDHVVPLSRGGADGPGNIVPACRNCNRSKSNRLLIDWIHRK